MKRFFFALLLLAGLTTAALAADTKPADKDGAIQMAESGWQTRCEKNDAKKCEAYDFLGVKDSKSRIAEFAVAFPESKSVARGVIILPLGILLESGVNMSVDDGKPYAFKVRYCTEAGCFAYIKMESALLETMKKGTNIKFQLKSIDGSNINLVLALEGFGKALKQIQ